VYLEVLWFVRAALSANLNLDVLILMNVLLSLVFAVLMEHVIIQWDHSIVSAITDIQVIGAKMLPNVPRTLNVMIITPVME
jgi:hypothetical protein